MTSSSSEESSDSWSESKLPQWEEEDYDISYIFFSSSSSSPDSDTTSAPDPTAADPPSDLLDRQNRAIAQILKHFRNMTAAAAAPLSREATLEHAALNRMEMENETAALVSTWPPPHPPHLLSLATLPPPL